MRSHALRSRLCALVLISAPWLTACDSQPEAAPPSGAPAPTAPTAAASSASPASASSASSASPLPAEPIRPKPSTDRARPDKEVFRAALATYFKTAGDLCLPPAPGWPAYLSETELRVDQSAGLGRLRQMDALTAVGLVRSEDIPAGGRLTPPGRPARPGPGKAFHLTEAALPFTLDVHWSLPTGARDTTEICWGRRTVDQVTTVFGPEQRADLGTQVAEVKYSYRIENQAAWATDAAVLTAFPDLKKTLDGVGQASDRLSLKLTDQGWEVIPPATTGSSVEIRRRGAALN